MNNIEKSLDKRRAHVKNLIEAGRAQMVRYFACRYSWGQPCDPRRAYDWGGFVRLLTRLSISRGGPRLSRPLGMA